MPDPSSGQSLPFGVSAALKCANAGWPIFPCHPDTKRPLVRADTDHYSGQNVKGTGGLKKATTDAAIIRAWWSQYPKASIGLPTGLRVGAFVVDIDAGMDSATGEVFTAAALIASLEAEIGVALPATWTCTTPRGGQHFYFAPPAGCAMPGNRTAVLPRIDVRGEGGFVLVPPSQRSDGKSYAWEIAPDQRALAQAPPELLDLILRQGRWANSNLSQRRHHQISSTSWRSATDRQGRYARAALNAEVAQLRNALPGTRNDRLFHASIALGQLVAAGGIEEATVRRALEDVVRDWPSVSKSLGTIESGLSKGLKEPRNLSGRSSMSDRSLPPQSIESGELSLDRELAHVDLTDRGNAERFYRRNGHRLRWNETLGWLVWSRHCWSRENTGAAVLGAVHETVEAIKREAASVRDLDPDE